MSEDIPLPFDLPSVGGKKLSVGFDGGQRCREEAWLGLADRLASCRLPESGDPLYSQPTMSRLDNAPSKFELARLSGRLQAARRQ